REHDDAPGHGLLHGPGLAGLRVEGVPPHGQPPAVRDGVVVRGPQRDPVRLPHHLRGGAVISQTRVGGEGAAATAAAPARRRLPLAIPIAIAVAWVLTLAAQLSGWSILVHHDSLIEGGAIPLWLATIVFLVAWQSMVVAMMLPSSLPMIRLFAATSAQQKRPGEAMFAFLGGYAVVWTLFALVAFLGD